MVASLQSRKEVLEAKLKEKYKELKKLCFEEAELTGSLPPETPLEPGESPPRIRRRVGTTFALPENLIDKLQSKEDKAIATLELDFKIQSGIAEAALGIANDVSSSKSVRRKHKIIYQETQRRLFDLESKLSALKMNQNRQKKGQIISDGEGECGSIDGNDINCNGTRHTGLPHSVSEPGTSIVRHFHAFSSLPRPDPVTCNQNYRGHPNYLLSSNAYYNNLGMGSNSFQKINILQHTPPYLRSPSQTPVDSIWDGNFVKDPLHADHSNNNYSLDSYSHDTSTRSQIMDTPCQRMVPYPAKENRMVSTLPRMMCTPPNTTVLLPSQTYPDNSLMRTQSLGNVGSYQLLPDKKKEKEWYETSLDSSPVPLRTQKIDHVEVPENHKSNVESNNALDNSMLACDSPSESSTHHAVIHNIQFDSVVPYESPKNHTVIEAGKWQPYREVTKPFEMSDFYKYSTKYRKGKSSPSPSMYNQNDRSSQQQKIIYRPLKPQECQPVSAGKLNASSDAVCNSPIPSENVLWFSEKRPVSSTSATIV